MRRLHVLWVNEAADFVGGCEQYIYNTTVLLRERDIQSTLLYDPCFPIVSSKMLGAFDDTSPIGDVLSQVAAIEPDVIYLHRLSGVEMIRKLVATSVPVIRFFHDYKLFCLREHKYKPFSLRACVKPIGIRCYWCPGFINRSGNSFGFKLSHLRAFRKEIRENLKLSAFVVGSWHMEEQIVVHGFDKRKMHVIPLYAMKPNTGVVVNRENDLLLFVGQLIRGKGIDTLLKALRQTKEPARLMLIGTGRQETLFRNQVAESGLEGRVSFLGQVPHEELGRYYRRARCVVVPSRFPESFGLIGPEAMSYGTPLIATTVGAIGEWLEDGVTGLAVPPNDSAALANAIDYMIENPERAAKMGEIGMIRYEERFTPKHHIDALTQLFESFSQQKTMV